jgi:hypothetical protein
MARTFKNPNKKTVEHVMRAIEKRHPGATRKAAVRGFAIRLARDLDRIIEAEVISPILSMLIEEAFK